MANELILITTDGLSNVGAKLYLNGLFAAQVLLSEDATYVYRGSMPPVLTGVPGEYNIGFFRNISQPNERLIATGVIFWDGNKEVDQLDIDTTLTKDGKGRLL